VQFLIYIWVIFFKPRKSLNDKVGRDFDDVEYNWVVVVIKQNIYRYSFEKNIPKKTMVDHVLLLHMQVSVFWRKVSYEVCKFLILKIKLKPSVWRFFWPKYSHIVKQQERKANNLTSLFSNIVAFLILYIHQFFFWRQLLPLCQDP